MTDDEIRNPKRGTLRDLRERLGVECGKCGSGDVHFAPCPECEYAQTFTCFGCGSAYHLPADHHDQACSWAVYCGHTTSARKRRKDTA